jgi:hypothetical protein
MGQKGSDRFVSGQTKEPLFKKKKKKEAKTIIKTTPAWHKTLVKFDEESTFGWCSFCILFTRFRSLY